MMKAEEMRSLNLEQLQEELNNSFKEQFNLRMMAGSGQAVKSHLLKNVRHKIARIKTIMTEQSMSAKLNEEVK